ncbi:MAG: ABC transporter permease, partial [Bacteroidetes bacterium]|nr:ABC transporter permease [Bacteroidota bacterium]
MKLLLKIALRYLLFTDPNKKHKNISFQSLFAILSVSLGVFALLLTITILNGFENEIITKIQKFSSHIKIQLYENKTLKDKSVILKAIDPIKNEIKSIYYEAESEAILTNNNDAEGVILKGVEPDYLKNILDRYKLEEFKSEQNLKNNLPEIIIGKKLQRKLNLKLGDEINILTLHQNLDIVEYKNHNFKISVIYESGMAEYDDIFCFVDLKIFQNMFLMGESFNTANINLINPENVKNYTNRIEAKLPRYYSVLNYLDLNKNLISWIQLQKGPTP